jgi:hypothetical protein
MTDEESTMIDVLGKVVSFDRGTSFAISCLALPRAQVSHPESARRRVLHYHSWAAGHVCRSKPNRRRLHSDDTRPAPGVYHAERSLRPLRVCPASRSRNRMLRSSSSGSRTSPATLARTSRARTLSACCTRLLPRSGSRGDHSVAIAKAEDARSWSRLSG